MIALTHFDLVRVMLYAPVLGAGLATLYYDGGRQPRAFVIWCSVTCAFLAALLIYQFFK